METTSLDLKLSSDPSLPTYESAMERTRSRYVELTPEVDEQHGSEKTKLQFPQLQTLTLVPPPEHMPPSTVEPNEWKHPSVLDSMGSELLIAGPPPEEESSSCKKCIVGTYYPSMQVSTAICALIITITLFPIGCIACCWVSDPQGRQCDECGHRDHSCSDLVIVLATLLSFVLWTLVLQFHFEIIDFW